MCPSISFSSNSVQGPDVHEPSPKGLYLAAAILIREGFVSLEELYPHVR